MLVLTFLNFYLLIPDREKERQNAANKIETERVLAEIQKYEEMVEQKPGYRDAYLKLAILNWKIYQDETAKTYLNLAQGIDPNEEKVKLVRKLLSGG